ncbi:hypothetical protein FH609_001640 [Streptomyces sp. 3MP-14]|uniref:Uncharacterized protein n=1 Tax=Streptomyces mimosae TaxID=2586635 RepID=A0A5N6ARY0_9ACTN|nr:MULTISPECIES: hypothetical protein [Streptomyces]KAB8170925.1 hypothetical protein FH607_000830 [Streptomyces mimosae]KAB8179724.1 hypothetical protein FH609_001640 [Streptomyces sp. 3MP-14]
MKRQLTLLAAITVAAAGAVLPAGQANGAERQAAAEEVGALACPSGMECGSYDIPGLGARKQQVTGAGADSQDLAVAMLETDGMSTDYPYGDNKTGDAANFGIFKQNWHMLRNACGRFQGQGADSWNNGAALNSDLAADVACLNQSQAHYGIDRWFAGHRNGESGLNNPNTPDIQAYRTAINWIQEQLTSDPANLSNDTRFWVSVPPI